MNKNIKIIVIKQEKEIVRLDAELNDTYIGRLIYDALPIEGVAKLWGEEIYFSIPVKAKLDEDSKAEVVKIGDIGYWPQGHAVCIFFGKTPISSSEEEIRPVSCVSLIGKLCSEPQLCKLVKEGFKIRIEKII